MAAQFQIDNISDSNVDDPEKPLITFLEFSLVKDLNGDNGRVLDIAGAVKEKMMRINGFEGRLERLTYQNSRSNRDSRSS